MVFFGTTWLQFPFPPFITPSTTLEALDSFILSFPTFLSTTFLFVRSLQKHHSLLLRSVFLPLCCSFGMRLFWNYFSLYACIPPSLSLLSCMQFNQIDWISVAAWLHRHQRHQREQKSITSPFSFSSAISLPSSFALRFTVSSSSSLSLQSHSTFPSYFNMLLLIKKSSHPPQKISSLFFLESRCKSITPHFFHSRCTSSLTVHDILTDSSWPVKVGGSREEED